MRDANGIRHGALNWCGSLDDLSLEEVKERADQMAWTVATAAASGTAFPRAINDPVVEFRNARDAWLQRATCARGDER